MADIGGKPMVIRVAERAKQSLAQSVVVATDSPEIQATLPTSENRHAVCRNCLLGEQVAARNILLLRFGRSQ